MDYLDVIRREGDAFYATALGADPMLGVPSCPDWSISDLVWHLGEVHWFWGTVIDQRVQDRDEMRRMERLGRPGDFPQLVAQGRRNLGRLCDILEKTDDATPVWTWAANKQDVGFIRRHQVQETAVHRWDMQNAATTAQPDPIDAAVASDAIDEFLAYSMPFGRKSAGALRGSVHLHCTDTEGEWFIHPDGRVEPIHQKGDVALRGGASDLLLALYARIDVDDLDVIGDGSIARQLIESVDLG